MIDEERLKKSMKVIKDALETDEGIKSLQRAAQSPEFVRKLWDIKFRYGLLN